jgi:hypothetical protein
VREAGGQMLDRAGKIRIYNQQDPLLAGGLAAGNERLVAQILQRMQEQADGHS